MSVAAPLRGGARTEPSSQTAGLWSRDPWAPAFGSSTAAPRAFPPVSDTVRARMTGDGEDTGRYVHRTRVHAGASPVRSACTMATSVREGAHRANV